MLYMARSVRQTLLKAHVIRRYQPRMKMIRSLMIPLANAIPQLPRLQPARMILLRLSGMKIGKNTQIWGPLIVRPLSCADQISIGSQVFINSEVRLAPRGHIYIGNRVAIGPRVSIETVSHSLQAQANGSRATFYEEVKVQDGCWICAGSTLLPGSSMGKESVLAAKSLLKKQMPAHELWGGVPAKHIKDIEKNIQ